jgi:hypothetical protein
MFAALQKLAGQPESGQGVTPDFVAASVAVKLNASVEKQIVNTASSHSLTTSISKTQSTTLYGAL